MGEQKTVTVRIAVAVSAEGYWYSCGSLEMADSVAMEFATENMDGGAARYYVTATLPLPTTPEVAGTVEGGA